MTAFDVFAMWLTVLASAREGPVELQWQAPASCPTPQAVHEAIAAELEGAVTTTTEETLEVRGSVVVEDDRATLRVVVSIGDATIERTVAGPTCSEFAETAALIVGIAYDMRMRSLPAPEPEPEPESEPQPEPEPQPAAPPNPAAPPRPARSAWIRATAGVQSGTLPTTATVSADAVFARSHVRGSIGAMYITPRREIAFPDSSAGALIQGAALRGRGCAVAATGAWRFPSCVGVESGLAIAQGINFASTRATARPWVTLTVGPELLWSPSRRVSVYASVDAALNVVLASFAADGLGLVYEASRFGVRGSAGVSIRLDRAKRRD